MASVVFSNDLQRRSFLFLNELRRHPFLPVPADLVVPDVGMDGCYSRQQMAKFLRGLGYIGFRCLPRLLENMVVHGLFLDNGKVHLIW